MTDPKAQPPTRLVVSGGPKAEPFLSMAHPIDQPTPKWRDRLALAYKVGLVLFLVAVTVYVATR